MSNNKQKQSFDAFAKVVVIGDSSVGKSNILLRYVSADCQMSHIATIGIDFKIKKIQLDGYKLKMQIWDTAGQQRFRNLTGTIYQGAQAIVLVYAINSRRSFENVEVWMKDIYEKMKGEYILAIAGNKTDLEEEREVATQEGVDISKKYKASIFTETSAKENINIDMLFEKVGLKIKQKLGSEKVTGEPKQPKKKQTSQQRATRVKTAQDRPAIDSKQGQNVKLSSSEAKKLKKKACC